MTPTTANPRSPMSELLSTSVRWWSDDSEFHTLDCLRCPADDAMTGSFEDAANHLLAPCVECFATIVPVATLMAAWMSAVRAGVVRMATRCVRVKEIEPAHQSDSDFDINEMDWSQGELL